MRKIRKNAAERREFTEQLHAMSFEDIHSLPCRKLFEHAAEVMRDLERRNWQLRQAVGNFADYYEPKGGISMVPSGPFYRAAETLGVRSVGAVASDELRDRLIAACNDTEE